VAVTSSGAAAVVATGHCWGEGAAVALIDPRLNRQRSASLLQALAPTHLYDDGGLSELEGGREVAAGTAAVVATSGTSGAPKLVSLTRAGMAASARAVNQVLEVTTEDCWLACLPLHYVAGLAILSRVSEAGCRLETQAGFAVASVADAAARCSLVSLVPTMLARLLDTGADLSGFRKVLLGGGPIPGALLERAAAAGLEVACTYGLTETNGGCVHDGHPLPGVEVAISPAKEILIRGKVVMAGYHRQPELTREAFDSEGWLRSGDLGAWGAGGELLVTERLSDIVATGGEKVSPAVVEAALARHPGVGEVCVAGAPDEEWGERVVAFIVPACGTETPSLGELRSFAGAWLRPAELPRQVVTVVEIARSPGGKVLRRLMVPMAEHHSDAWQ
jgi:o-succinylbenzoate---CoA ligase